MAEDEARGLWLKRVLGVDITPAGAAPAAEAFDDRLQQAGRTLRALADAKAPEASALAAQLAAARAAASAGAPDAAALLDGLEAGLARAQSAMRGREAGAANPRSVVYRKMLLRWREVQALVAANLTAVGKSVLARPDVQADPRIDEVKQAVAMLPTLVPSFGGALEDVLDAGMNAPSGDELDRLATAGVAAIDAYRTQLGAASQLLELEAFAAEDLGQGLGLHRELDAVLDELRQELAA